MTTRKPTVGARLRAHPSRYRWLGIAVVAIVGVPIFTLVTDPGLRAGLSYLGGLLLVGGAMEFGAFNIRLAGRVMPGLTLPVAMISYLTTALVFALALVASSPRVVDGLAVAIGLFVGLAIWLGGEMARAWVVQEPL